MKLSKYVTVAAFELSATAERRGIPNHMSVADQRRAKALCTKVLDPIREYYDKPILITSGFRSIAINSLIGGSSTSQHLKGEAADFTISGVSVKQVFDDIRTDKIKIEYDQLIEEFGGWVHISYREGNNRKQAMIARRGDGRTIYTQV